MSILLISCILYHFGIGSNDAHKEQSHHIELRKAYDCLHSESLELTYISLKIELVYLKNICSEASLLFLFHCQGQRMLSLEVCYLTDISLKVRNI